MHQTLGDVSTIDIPALLERYALVLIDAYGVLVSGRGALPGARELLEAVQASGRAWFIVTNDASRSPASCAARYRELGLPIDDAHVITSGALVVDWFRDQGLADAKLRTLVMGPEDSRQMVRDAGGVLVPFSEDDTVDVVVVCDDAGYPLLESIDAAITMVFRSIDAGRPPHLVLPNPDLIYPKGGGAFGITAGSVAGVIEQAVALRYPQLDLRFVRLGKPFTPIFEAAFARAGTRDAVLIGDQLATDIKGANNAGIDSALVETGITISGDDTVLDVAVPTWRLLGFT